MPKAYYVNDDELEHIQRIADNIPHEPHKREYYRIKPAMTLQEIADDIGVSKARVGQIIENALRKLRRSH